MMQVMSVGETDRILQLAVPMVTIFSSVLGLQFSHSILRITPPLIVPSEGCKDITLVRMANVEELYRIYPFDSFTLTM
jgi:hypothetical protein